MTHLSTELSVTLQPGVLEHPCPRPLISPGRAVLALSLGKLHLVNEHTYRCPICARLFPSSSVTISLFGVLVFPWLGAPSLCLPFPIPALWLLDPGPACPHHLLSSRRTASGGLALNDQHISLPSTQRQSPLSMTTPAPCPERCALHGLSPHNRGGLQVSEWLGTGAELLCPA